MDGNPWSLPHLDVLTSCVMNRYVMALPLDYMLIPCIRLLLGVVFFSMFFFFSSIGPFFFLIVTLSHFLYWYVALWTIMTIYLFWNIFMYCFTLGIYVVYLMNQLNWIWLILFGGVSVARPVGPPSLSSNLK